MKIRDLAWTLLEVGAFACLLIAGLICSEV